jgi:hypothetical protein
MAPRNRQGITPGFVIQMDSNHVDVSSGQVQVELEPFHNSTGLLRFHQNIEAKSGIGPKFDFFTRQFLEPFCVSLEPWRILIRPLEPGAVCLLCEIMTKLKTKLGRIIKYHPRETRFIGEFPVSGQIS